MGKEQVRVSTLVLDEGLSTGVMEFFAGFGVPRRCIGQLIDIDMTGMDMSDTLGLTDVNHVTGMGLVRGNSIRADRTFTAGNWNNIDTIVATMTGSRTSGLGPAITMPVSPMRIHEDFVDNDPRNRVNNRSGPQTNHPNGYQFFLAALGNDGTRGFIMATMTIELDWPKNTSMPWKEEHIANEENQ